MTKNTPNNSDASGLEIALQWAELPTDHLQVALAALEPQLQREHEIRKIKLQHDRESIKERRNHLLYMTGLYMAFTISVGAIAGATVAGLEGNLPLALILCGPTILSIIGIFALRKSSASQIREASKQQKELLASAQLMQP
ncbi:hypothetical protein [Herbidospora daliensis]|uniref:hypothetical protein n=1 Tax=Herbidospora daliensis TaxID=295585 RepID=UPI0012F96F53|nr:hypothetical protein [Herbidospora daliensis]